MSTMFNLVNLVFSRYRDTSISKDGLMVHYFSILSDITSCRFGSFFGPSQPVIAPRVIEESRLIRENKHIVAKVSSSGVCVLGHRFHTSIIFHFNWVSLQHFTCFCRTKEIPHLQK